MIIEVNHYTKVIHKAKVLDDITLTFKSGKIYGLKGKNGSGKTMLMRAVCGLIFPTDGEVLLDGKRIGRELEFPPSAGLLLESPSFLPGKTGYQNLRLLGELKGVIGEEEIRRTLDEVGLDPDDKRKYRKYSMGMKQRLGIAAALMERPELILLDEPTNALDEGGIVKLRELLHREKERGALILLSCHDTEELRFLSDEIITLKEGKVQKTETMQDFGESPEDRKESYEED